MNKHLLFALALLCLLAFAGFTYQPARTRWEYKLVTTDAGKVDLNSLGEEGWELVAVEAEGKGVAFVFKRAR